MVQPFKILDHNHCPEELKKLASQENNARMRIRLLEIYHFRLGNNRAKVARNLGDARGSVSKWVDRYLNHGLESIQTKASTGRPSKLLNTQRAQIGRLVLSQVDAKEGGWLLSEDIQVFIAQQFNVKYSLRNIYHLFHGLGFSWVTSRSKQSEQTQEVFKSLSTGNDLSHPV